jgi:hypothetical protein
VVVFTLFWVVDMSMQTIMAAQSGRPKSIAIRGVVILTHTPIPIGRLIPSRMSSPTVMGL